MDDDHRLLTVPEAAQLVRVSRRTVYQWIEQGTLMYQLDADGFIRIVASSLWNQPAIASVSTSRRT